MKKGKKLEEFPSTWTLRKNAILKKLKKKKKKGKG